MEQATRLNLTTVQVVQTTLLNLATSLQTTRAALQTMGAALQTTRAPLRTMAALQTSRVNLEIEDLDGSVDVSTWPAPASAQ